MKLQKYASNKWIFLLIVIFIVIFIVFNSLSPLLLWDENAYLANARSHLKTANYAEDFRFPFIEYVLAGAWFLTGESIFVAKLVIILFSAATLYMMYRIFGFYFDEKKSLLFTFLFGINVQFLLWGFRAYTEIITIFFFLVSFWFIKKDNYLAAGIFSSLAFLARFTSLIFPISVGLYLIFGKKFKKLSYFALGSAILLVPWLIYNQLKYSNILWDFIEYYKIVKMYTYWEPISSQIFNLLFALGPLIILLPGGIHQAIKRRGSEISLLIYIGLSLVYYLFMVNIKYARYNLVIYPFVYLVSFLSKQRKNKWLFIVIIIYLVAVAGYTSFNIAENGRCDEDGAYMNSIEFIKSNAEEGGSIISNIWPWFGYYLNMKASGLWNNNLDELISESNATYVIYNINLHDYNETILKDNLVLVKSFKDECLNQVDVYSTIS